MWNDVVSLKAKDLPDVDGITAGFPCQAGSTFIQPPLFTQQP
jgi:site-specific DNA-cytosine methylase